MSEEELVENAVIQLFDLSNYSDSLPTEAKERYLSKLADIGCDCPYTISNTFWSSGPDIDNVIPPVERGDLWNYLVYGKSLYTDSEMKNYKSCQSYKIIIGEGLFFDFKCLKLSNLNVICTAKVHHSMAFSLPPLRPWVAFNQAGTVLTGHCDCIGGLSECCSHVGAVLFAAELINAQKRELSVTEKPMQWMKKTSRPNMIETVSELKNTQKNKSKKLRVDSSPISTDAFKMMMEEYMNSGIQSALLTVLPDYSKNFIPLQLKVTLPDPLSKIFSSHFRGKPLSVLLKESEDLFSNYCVSNQQAEAIEMLTRAQSKSELWNSFRLGRITASVVKSVITTSIDNPSKTVVLKICYPNINSFSTPATKWGRDNEKKALKVWGKKLKSENLHTGFSIDEAGLTIYQSHPFLAASPDAIFNCPCHGRAVVEVKCPFKHADKKILTAATNDKEFCLYVTESDELALKKNHSYYSQIQFQMMVCQVDVCFFIVYTKVDMVFLTVNYDTNYQRETIPNCKDFAKTVILPELIGKFYTETRYGKQVNVENELQLPSTSINIENEEQSVNNDANRNVLMNLDTNISSVDISSSNVISNPSIHISDKNPLPFIMQSSSCSTFYGPCFCNVHRANETMVVCCSPSCRVKTYHRSCLLSLGKKRFGENWTCDDCKQQRKKVLKVRKPLKSVN